MRARGRTTQHKDVERSFGGRGGFVSEELVVGGYRAFIACLALAR